MWETEVVFFIYAKNIYCPLCLVSDMSPYKIEGELRREGPGAVKSLIQKAD